ncbi:caspase domain-containing protein [Crassisporium funariophilum]|nr:caspase domain-containing protein [Crassisporium funariophilum]
MAVLIQKSICNCHLTTKEVQVLTPTVKTQDEANAYRILGNGDDPLITPGTSMNDDSNSSFPSSIESGSGSHQGLGRALKVHSQPSSNNKRAVPLFALIVGIDEYKDPPIPNLKGCVQDSNSIYKFLIESFHANPLHIKHLKNEQATREGILAAFESHLVKNTAITRNDPIVFYFAGHGSCELAPEGWLTANKMMETICPHDERTGEEPVRGIPDLTISFLMRKLASAQGNNITAIVDSCHAGGIGRNSANARYLPPPSSPFPASLDKSIWNLETENVQSRLPTALNPSLPFSALKSHVLVAACQPGEVAFETALKAGKYSGAFTTLLLKVLKQCNLGETTYLHVLNRLADPQHKLNNQNPLVQGDHKSRILFSMSDLGRNTFSVSSKTDKEFSVAAGTIHGVDGETEFRITSGRDLHRAKPSRVLPLSSVFTNLDEWSITAGSRAEVVKWNRPRQKVFVAKRKDDHSIEDDHQETGVSLTLADDKHIELERLDPLLLQYAKRFITVMPGDHSGIEDAIYHFNFFLYNQNEHHPVGNRLSVKLERLVEIPHEHENEPKRYGPATPQVDFFTSGERLMVEDSPLVTASVKITDLDADYCLTLRSDYPTPLYPYVFGFDPSNYQIVCFYHPEYHAPAPLHGEHEVTIGYGAEGGDPFTFQKDDPTFYKVFVTSKWVDLAGLEQAALFVDKSASRFPDRRKLDTGEFWDSWIYVTA